MELMKSGLSENAIYRIRSALEQVLGKFDGKEFVREALMGLDTLELKQRVQHIIKIMHCYFPKEFSETVNALMQIESVWDHGNPDDPLRGFAAWPIIDYVAEFGLENPEESLPCLERLTSLFSAEFAIRPFIKKYPELCQEYLEAWSHSESEHVRRLASEGTRPRLPWGVRLTQYIEDPIPNIPLLNTLKSDESLYVRRSVANHLNDISKDNPQIVLDTCKGWLLENGSEEVKWVIKHGLRTLVKAGEAQVFPLLGFTQSPRVYVSGLDIADSEVKVGDTLKFNFTLSDTSAHDQKLVVDYAIHFVKANGRQAKKVFKLKNISLKANEQHIFSKTHSFKLITTRKYYSGSHLLHILVNGTTVAERDFNLNVN